MERPTGGNWGAEAGWLFDTPEVSGESPAKGTVTASPGRILTPREKLRSLAPVLVRVSVCVSCPPLKSVDWSKEGAILKTGGGMAEPISDTTSAASSGSSLSRNNR